jgi:hypothetical protein
MLQRLRFQRCLDLGPPVAAAFERGDVRPDAVPLGLRSRRSWEAKAAPSAAEMKMRGASDLVIAELRGCGLPVPLVAASSCLKKRKKSTASAAAMSLLKTTGEH